MSKRAEEKALEAYPVDVIGHTIELAVGSEPKPMDWNENNRKCYAEGYKQAEKDTIERAIEWITAVGGNEYTSCDIEGNSWICARFIKDFRKAMEKE